jgi:hypothetical protein
MNWGFISQKTAFFIVTGVETSNLTISEVKNAVFWNDAPCGSCENRRQFCTKATRQHIPQDGILLL